MIEGDLGLEPPAQNKELRIAYFIAFFAAALSFIDIGANNYRDKEIVGVNKKMTEYSLYHSKILKETLIQAERDLLFDLMRAGAVVANDTSIVNERLRKFDQELTTIRSQQTELMNGSVPDAPAQWSMPDINEELGKIKGLRNWEYEVEMLDLAGDKFDLASLLLELSLVMGAMGFIVRFPRAKNLFRWLMIGFGAIGIGFGLTGYYHALSL
ncbi:MAG: DUF4337 family protein [Cyclobacteriaceae bacterium]